MGGGHKVQPWNTIASKTVQNDENEMCGRLSQVAPPKTGQEFLRQWRQYKGSTTEQYRYVQGR